MKDPKALSDGAEKRHQPKQSRSVETWNSILDAAAELFGDRGYEATTTHQIAAKAGVSVGALYRYFSHKEAILKELFDREIAGLRKDLLAGFFVPDLTKQDPRDLVRHTIRTAFSAYASRRSLARVMQEQARKIPELREQLRAHEDGMHRGIAGLLATVPGVQLPDLELGAYMIRRFIESLITDFVLSPDPEPQFDEDRVVEGAMDFLLRYILGEIKDAQDPSVTTENS